MRFFEIKLVLRQFYYFGDLNSYLTFKLSVWKRGCAISFELQIPQTSSTHFGKHLQNLN